MAQDIPQITLGGGVGAAKAYGGTEVQKTNFAWFVEAGYYPVTKVEINAEEQIGIFSGSSLHPNGANPKSFINHYAATIFNVNVVPIVFFNDNQSELAHALKNIYIGTGLGFLGSNVTNLNTGSIQVIDHTTNLLPMVPLKLEYEYSLINNRMEPVLKLDLISTFYYTIGKGIDGYYDSFEKRGDFYNFLNISIKYPLSLGGGPGKPYNKFD